jgi:hypothetical protein
MNPLRLAGGLVEQALPDCWKVFYGTPEHDLTAGWPVDLPDQYAVVNCDSGLAVSTGLDCLTDIDLISIQVMLVASAPHGGASQTAELLGLAARRVRNHLVSNRLTATGALIRHTVSSAPLRDTAVAARYCMYTIDRFIAAVSSREENP